MISDSELEVLAEDIREHGLQEPLVQQDGVLLDGRNRLKACSMAGVDPRWREYDGDDPVVFIISANLKRRHLTESQLAALAVELEPHFAREAKTRQATSGPGVLGGKPLVATVPQAVKGKSRDAAGKAVGVSGRSVSGAKVVAKEDPALFDDVKSGKKTVTAAVRILRERKREEERGVNRAKVESSVALDQLEGCFSTIVIDPPWDWDDEGDADQLGRARPTYQTMSLEKIAALPVSKFAADNAHLYLWITNRSLPKGFGLLEQWGFRYVTTLTWCKPSIGMGNYFRGSTEHLLFGVRGSLPLQRKNVGTWFAADRGPKHSTKPNEAYVLIESCSPGPRIEMFARGPRDGWTVWGAET